MKISITQHVKKNVNMIRIHFGEGKLHAYFDYPEDMFLYLIQTSLHQANYTLLKEKVEEGGIRSGVLHFKRPGDKKM